MSYRNVNNNSFLLYKKILTSETQPVFGILDTVSIVSVSKFLTN